MTEQQQIEALDAAITALQNALEPIAEPPTPGTALKQTSLVYLCRMIVKFKDQPEAAK